MADSRLPYVEAAGWGRVVTGMVSVLDNYGSRREDAVLALYSLINAAIGVYRERTLQSLNPLFWIEFLVFLPRELLRGLGASGDGLLSKIATGAWWAVGVATTLLLSIFRPEIEAYVREVVARL